MARLNDLLASLDDSHRERFMQMVSPEPNSGCWLWTGHIIPSSSYGQSPRGSFGVGESKAAYAHRVSYVLHKGPIPEGMLVCHKCDTPLCVNPDHLWLGTNEENLADMNRKGRNGASRYPEKYRAIGRRLAANKTVERGEAHASSKLTDAQVLAIRADRRRNPAIAAQLGVHRSTIGQIKRGRTWRHLLEKKP